MDGFKSLGARLLNRRDPEIHLPSGDYFPYGGGRCFGSRFGVLIFCRSVGIAASSATGGRRSVGTWGNGPFGSDSAQDILEEFEQLSAAERRAELERIFAVGAEPRPREAEEILPEEVLAGAAVVAANLPAGENLAWNEEAPGIADWLSEPSAEQLSTSAAAALSVVLAPGNWWWQSWVAQGDRDRMQDVVDQINTVLAGF
jgi:alpha-glucosidase